jgi:hypothetical protein
MEARPFRTIGIAEFQHGDDGGGVRLARTCFGPIGLDGAAIDRDARDRHFSRISSSIIRGEGGEKLYIPRKCRTLFIELNMIRDKCVMRDS